MTQDEVIEMAEQAGWPDSLVAPIIMAKLNDFAKLVSAKEKEDIIKAIESLGTWAHIEEVVNTIRGLK
jgi:hypothetical protein